MDTLLQDLRYSLRMLRRSPGFALVALAALTLGIGANTAIFSVVNAVLLRPLPYPEPERLVAVAETDPRDPLGGHDVSYPNFLDWERESRAFETLAAWTRGGSILTGDGEPVRVEGAWITPGMFDLLGAAPALGRDFLPAERRPGGDPVILVSHALWQGRLGGDPGVLGRTLILDADPFTVVGVMPADLRFPSRGIDVWAPLGSLADRPFLRDRDVHVLRAMGRLAEGVTLPAARRELATIAAGIQERHPGEDDGHGIGALSLHDRVVGDARPALLLLLGAVAFVLLIACANVANLLLARGAARRREMALRAVLGASRGRALRQLLTESLLLGLLGGASSLLAAVWGVDLLSARLADLLPRADGIRLDGGVLLFTLGISLLTGLLFGILPALQARRGDLSAALRGAASTTTADPGRRRLRHGLIVAELALSLVLLAGTGLLMRSFWQVLDEPPGFDPANLLLMTVSLPVADFPETQEVVAFYRDLPPALEVIPGVRRVSAVNRAPISGGDSGGMLTIEDRPFAPGEAPAASFRRVLPGYFGAMGIPVLRGREFDARDDGSREVVLISETMARRHWPEGEAIGSRIKIGPPEREPWLTVIGVVGDVRNVGLEQAPALATYEPHAQRPWRTMRLAIRAEGPPGHLATAVRRALREREPRLLVSDVATMQERIARSVAPRLTNLTLLGLFAAVAVLLTCVGIYGVMAYSVIQRTREIGVRAALGAGRRDLLLLVVGQGLRLALAGAVLGTALALGLTRLMGSLLHGVGASDPATFLAIPAVLLAAALLASYLPARRAARLDPMRALRHE